MDRAHISSELKLREKSGNQIYVKSGKRSGLPQRRCEASRIPDLFPQFLIHKSFHRGLPIFSRFNPAFFPQYVAVQNSHRGFPIYSRFFLPDCFPLFARPQKVSRFSFPIVSRSLPAILIPP